MNKLTGFVLVGIVFGWIVRFVIIAVIVFIVFGSVAQLFTGSEPPAADKAIYAIQSYTEVDGFKRPSRIYFTNEILYEDNLPVVKEYWRLDGEDYKHVKEERVFTEPITIVRRTQ